MQRNMKIRYLIILLASVALCFCSCSSSLDSAQDTTKQKPIIDYKPSNFQTFVIHEIPDINLDELYEDKTYTVSYTAYLSYNSHVGNSWAYGLKYDGECVESGSSVVKSGIFNLSVTAYAVEFDEHNDYGSASVYFDSLDVGEKQTKEVTVTVREDRGRYSGNTAGWIFEITIERTS